MRVCCPRFQQFNATSSLLTSVAPLLLCASLPLQAEAATAQVKSELEAQLAAASSRCCTLEADSAAAAVRLAALEAELQGSRNEAEDRAAQLSRQVADLSQQIGAAGQEAAALHADVAAKGQQLRALQQEVAAVLAESDSKVGLRCCLGRCCCLA